MNRSTDTKRQVRELLEQLPDDCSVEDVQYRLYVMETIRRRIEAADRGEFVHDEEALARLQKWLVK